MALVIDSDQHLFEPRDLWERSIDPGSRDDALAVVDDTLGHPWLRAATAVRSGLADGQPRGASPPA